MDNTGMFPASGGTSPAAVAALYKHLRARLEGRAAPTGKLPWLVAEPGHQAPARVRQPLDGVDVVLRTSGSTDGTGHLVGLSLGALTASASATLERLSGPGQWLTSLPIHGVGGLQVVTRSALAGIPPVVPAGRLTPTALADAAAAMRADVPRYLSLVPTQLVRVLEQAPTALRGFAAVLVGGAAVPSATIARARAAGVRVVTTYGMTETAGGCVYDGAPLPGVRVRVVDGVIHIAGPVLATRYLDTDRQPFAEEADGRWLVTADLGALDADGRLTVLGRTDDVIISGGTNVVPSVLEGRLAARFGGAWLVVGLPDPEWGQRVVAVREGTVPDLARVREATADLPPALRPKEVRAVESFPTRASGKADRRALTAALARRPGAPGCAGGRS